MEIAQAMLLPHQCENEHITIISHLRPKYFKLYHQPRKGVNVQILEVVTAKDYEHW